MVEKETLVTYSIYLVALIILVMWLNYLYDTQLRSEINSPYFIRKIRNAKRSEQYSGKRLVRPTISQDITYGLWLNVNDWEYKKDEFKHVFHQGDFAGHRCLPGVWITPNVNNMIITFETDEIHNYYDYKLGYPSYLEKIVKEFMDNNFTSNGNIEIYKNRVNYDEANSEFTTTKNYQEIMNTYNNAAEVVVVLDKGSVLERSSVPYLYIVIYDNIKLKQELIAQGKSANSLNTKFETHPFGMDNNDQYLPIVAYTVRKTNKIQSLNPSINQDLVAEKMIKIDNIPLNRWFYLTIVIKDLYVNVYIDSYLVKSFGFKGLLVYNNGDLFATQNGGFGGYISQLRYYNRELSMKEIKETYLKGPSGFIFPRLNRRVYPLNIDPEGPMCSEDDTSLLCVANRLIRREKAASTSVLSKEDAEIAYSLKKY